MDEQPALRRDDGARRRRLGGWATRVLVLLLVIGVSGVSTGPTTGLTSPDLRLVSLTNPAPPTNVIVTPKDRSLDVDWTAPLEASIDSYRVYVDGVLAASPNGRSATISNLVNGRSYVITVRTVTKLGATYEGTTTSDPVSGIPRDTSAPPAPSGVSAVGGDRQVTVSWTAGTTYDIDGYRVLRNGTPVTGLLSGAGTTSYIDTGLSADTAYSYAVQAHDTSNNWSNSSSTVNVRTLDPYPPAAPTGLIATRGENRVTLSWTANAEPDLVSYRVMRDDVEIATVPAGTTSYINTGLTNDVTYQYTLVAVDTSDNRSPPSAPPASATPTDLTAPVMPIGLTAVPGNTRVTLSWTANTEPDLAYYRVQRNGVDVAISTATTYVDTGLTNGTSYSYRIVAVDTHANASPPSAAKTAIPRDPAPPINVIITPQDRELDVEWTAPPEGDIDGYNVYLDGVLVASPGGRSATLSGLVNGRSYTVTVRTVVKVNNILQEGERFSSPVSGVPRDTTPPPAPTGVTATGGDRQATVRWTASTVYDADGYRVLRNGVPVTGLLSGVGTVSWVDTNIAAGTYSYTVQAHDTSGNWSNSSAAANATVVDNPPAVPTGLSATRGDGRVSLTWTANTEPDLASYRVLRGGVQIATVTAATSYVDTVVINDTTYSYSLVAVDAQGNASAASSPAVSATPTDLTAPAAPVGLVATRGDGQVSLTWAANSEPDLATYRILRDGVEFATVVGTSYTDSGRTNDVTYSYTLVAVDTHGNVSPASAPAVSATPTDLTPPAAPTGVVGGRGDGRAGLAWDANIEPDLASYRVLRDGVEIASVTATNYLDLGLTNDTTYTYTLVAVDTHGNRSAPSVAVPITPTDLTPPDAPTGLVATRGDGQVTLSWTANTEPDLDHYVVVRDLVDVATVSAGTGYVDLGVVNDTEYTYTVAAVDTHGNRSVSSAPATATPTDLGAPAVPTGLVATRGDGQVSLSWTANSETDLSTYRLLRDGVQIVALSGTSYVDAGLTNDTEYSYTLAAVDTHGNRSADSPPVTATPTDLTAPAAPTGLVATRGDGQVSLSWAANTEPDLASYRVLRGGVEIATVTGATSYLDTGRTNDVAYSYRLVAVDTHGNRSVESASVSATPTDLTAPAPPTGLVATRGDGQVSLSWAANTEPDLASYRVLRDGVEIATVTGATNYLDTGRTNDVTYSYRLVAVDTHGNRSVESAPASATPTDLTAPAAPTGLVATEDDAQVGLSWAANTEPDLASYRVLRDGVEIATVTGTAYTDTGRTNDVTYVYRLVAVDTHGNRSAESASVSATPTTGAPAAPTGVTATPGDRRATISWAATGDPRVASYRVLAEDGSTAATATAPATQVAVAGLTNGTTYRFTVVAVGTDGQVSPPSATVTVVPASPAVPALGGGESGGLAASGDGRYVVVGTRAKLEASDTNSAYELYLMDRTAGTARRIAPLPASASAADSTNNAAPAISADGRSVVLATTAALVAGDTNGLLDVYRLDTSTSSWSLVSVPAAGTVNPGTAGAVLQTGASVYATSPPVVMSADGDLVLFYSARADLVPGDTNGVVDLFAKQLSTGTVTRVSTTSTGGNLAGAATGPALALTPDGRFALFPAASATGVILLYRKTLSGAGAGDLVVVSSVTVAASTTQFAVYRDAGDIDLSDDGRYVALVTAAKITTATPGANGSTGLAYRIDTATGNVLALGNGQQTVWEHQVELDPTGRYAFFATTAAALPADTNAHTDHYRRDLAGDAVGPLVLVTADADGKPTAGPIGSITPAEYGRLIALSGDRVVVTTSQALVSADTNRLRDLYVKDLVSGTASSPLG